MRDSSPNPAVPRERRPRHPCCFAKSVAPWGKPMSLLGRRRHSRFLLAQPVEGNLRVREDVVIEALTEHEVVIISSDPFRPQERFALEIPGATLRRINVSVVECRPMVIDDGTIRHRCRLSIEKHGAEAAHVGGYRP